MSRKKKHTYHAKFDTCENCISNTGGILVTAGRYGPKTVMKQPSGCGIRMKYPHKRFTAQSCRFFRRKEPMEDETISSAKPWHDSESLFCSQRLKEITGKEPEKGTKCSNNKTQKEME